MNAKANEISNNKLFKWTLVSLLVIIFVIIVTLMVLYIIACNVGYLYAILIDAGSTSSKISVFKWRDWPFQKNGRVEEVYMQKVSPGISNYKDHPEEAFNKLKPSLLALLKEHVPQQSKKSTRLFLAATAGMRLVELDNPLKADAIMESLRSQLPHVGAKVNNPYSDIRIMSGRDEGINAWITVNYLEKTLGAHDVTPSNGQQMIGALDLGGASAQITFVPKNPSLAPHTSTRYLFGSEFYVYSYSHLCYGKSASQKRVWAEIIGKTTTDTINNPCFLKNYSVKVKKSEIFAEPCVKSKYAVELIGSELIPDSALPEELTLVGTGDPDQCRQFVQKMFPTKACAQTPCMFQGVYRPPLHGKFSAFSGYAFVINHLDFPSKGHNLTRDAVKTKVDEFCRRDWNQVKKEHPASSLEFVAGYCQDGVYIDALLSNYGFVDSDSWKNIVFASKIAGTTVSWAPGYLIDATGMIDSESPRIDLGLTAFVTSVVILGIIFVALLVILVFLYLRH